MLFFARLALQVELLERLKNLRVHHRYTLRTTAVNGVLHEQVGLVVTRLAGRGIDGRAQREPSTGIVLMIVLICEGSLEHDFHAEFSIAANAGSSTAVAGHRTKAFWRPVATVVAALVPVRTVTLAADLTTGAGEAANAGLPNGRMILLLLPPMRVATPVLMGASVRVLSHEALCLPILTQARLVAVVKRFAPQVLPVVSVHALLLVVLVRERAPRRLEIEHVEVRVLIHAMQQVNGQLVFAVSEGTEHASIFAAVYIVRVALTEFGLVFFGMIKLLDSIVSQLARVAVGTLVASRWRRDERTHGGRVHSEVTSTVLVEIMVMVASLRVMVWHYVGRLRTATSFQLRAYLRLESGQIKEHEMCVRGEVSVAQILLVWNGLLKVRRHGHLATLYGPLLHAIKATLELLLHLLLHCLWHRRMWKYCLTWHMMLVVLSERIIRILSITPALFTALSVASTPLFPVVLMSVAVALLW